MLASYIDPTVGSGKSGRVQHTNYGRDPAKRYCLEEHFHKVNASSLINRPGINGGIILIKNCVTGS